MTAKTFREINNYIYASMIILAAISVNNSKVLWLFPLLIIADGISWVLCSYYKLTKFSKYKISRYFIGFLGVFFIISGSICLLYEIYFFIF